MKNLVNYISKSADNKNLEKIFNDLKTYFDQNKQNHVNRTGSSDEGIDTENANMVEDLFYKLIHLCLDENKFGDAEYYQSWAVGIEGAFHKINDEQNWI